MSAEEDTELRDLIIQTLENNGVIGRIKAELRASVFLALEEEGSFRDKIPLVNTRLMQFLSKPDGMLVVSLIREFLQFFNLNFTLAVFEPEITACDFHSKDEMRRRLKLAEHEVDSPILAHLVKIISDHNQETIVDYDKTINEPSIKNVESKVSDDEFTPVSLDNNQDAFTSALSDKFAEISSTNQNKVPDTIRGYANDADDPFFDEPLPLEKKQLFSVTKVDVQKDVAGTSLDKQSDLFDLKPEAKALEKSSLSSLRDLPSLNTKNSEVTDWGLDRSTKKKVSPMDVDTQVGEGEYDDEDFHSSASGHSAKSSQNSINMGGQAKTDVTDNQDNSEQSIEEEIEEDLSGGVDDLLNSSLSFADDVTTDQTVSQVSLVGGSDYMESCNPSK